MQISQIEAFVETARLGSLTRAAEALFITQPTITERLRSLEREVGQPLFVRTQHGVTLTDAGKTLLPYARRILQNVSEAKTAIANLATDAQDDLLCLGAAFFVGLYLLPIFLQRFRNARPGARVSVRTGHSEEVMGMVLRDEVQIGLIRNLEHRQMCAGVESIKLCKDEMLLVAGHDHPFSHLAEVHIEEVAQEGIISHDCSTDYCQLVDGLFLNAGLSLRVRARTDNLETVIGMAKKGLGVTLLTRAAVQSEIEAGGLKSVPIVGSPLPACELMAIYRKASDLSEDAQAFLRNVEETVLTSIPGSGLTSMATTDFRS